MNEGDRLLERSAGVVSLEGLRKTPGYPTEERFKKGPVPVIECVEEIPCNPCQTVCDRNLIQVGTPITNLPRLVDPEGECSGCARCIAICPGLAVFIVDKTFSETEASIAIPHELLPLPGKGERVLGVDRAGREVCEGYVQRVIAGKKMNRTSVVTIVVPREHAEEVRYFRRKGR
jgi:Fe-S-cluster-containing hydrogenase component 2